MVFKAILMMYLIIALQNNSEETPFVETFGKKNVGIAQSTPPQFAEPPKEIWTYRATNPVLELDVSQSDIVYIVTKDCDIIALDKVSGKPKWQIKLPKTRIDFRNANILATGDNSPLYAVSLTGYLYAIQKDKGAVLWRKRFTRGQLIPPAIDSRGVIYLGYRTGHDKGKFLAYDPRFKRIIWQVNTLGAVQNRAVFDSRNTVFYGTDRGSVYARTKNDGHLKWHVRSKLSSPLWEEISASLYVGLNGRLYSNYSARQPKVVPFYGRLCCFNAENGRLLWEKRSSNGISASIIQDKSGTVIFSPDTNQLFALDWQKGTVKWKEELTSAGRQPSIDSRGEVIIGGEDAIEAHSLGTGKLRWSFPASGGVPLIIKATGKEIIFTSHDNTVTALR